MKPGEFIKKRNTHLRRQSNFNAYKALKKAKQDNINLIQSFILHLNGKFFRVRAASIDTHRQWCVLWNKGKREFDIAYDADDGDINVLKTSNINSYHSNGGNGKYPYIKDVFEIISIEEKTIDGS
jgi:hypothetical protein